MPNRSSGARLKEQKFQDGEQNAKKKKKEEKEKEKVGKKKNGKDGFGSILLNKISCYSLKNYFSTEKEKRKNTQRLFFLTFLLKYIESIRSIRTKKYSYRLRKITNVLKG